jgi:hypothetical protein
MDVVFMPYNYLLDRNIASTSVLNHRPVQHRLHKLHLDIRLRPQRPISIIILQLILNLYIHVGYCNLATRKTERGYAAIGERGQPKR